MDKRNLTFDADTLKRFIRLRLNQFIKDIIDMSNLKERKFSDERKEELITKILNSIDLERYIKKTDEKQSRQINNTSSQTLTKLILEGDDKLFSLAKQMADTGDLVADWGIDFNKFSDKVDTYSEVYSINKVLLYETVRLIDKHTDPEKRKMMKKYLIIREKIRSFELKKADALKRMQG